MVESWHVTLKPRNAPGTIAKTTLDEVTLVAAVPLNQTAVSALIAGEIRVAEATEAAVQMRGQATRPDRNPVARKVCATLAGLHVTPIAAALRATAGACSASGIKTVTTGLTTITGVRETTAATIGPAAAGTGEGIGTNLPREALTIGVGMVTQIGAMIVGVMRWSVTASGIVTM
jgi:hypothetical protein